jgi:hypothetical protein
MTTLWIAIVGVALASATIKAAGPVVIGGRELPPSVAAIIALLAPALLSALVVVQTLTSDGELAVDAKLAGVGLAAVAILLRAPMLVVIAAAAGATALIRALA